MARTSKTGIDYFPFDIDFFQDEKIQFVSARFGMKGEAVTVRLMCKIYRNGYYTEFNDDTALLFAKGVGDGCQDSCVKDVVYELLKRGFFDRSIFERFGILTSRGIQNRYFEAVKRYRQVEAIREYLLVDVSKMINVNINSINVNINPQIERENEKEKEKERESYAHTREAPDFSSEIFFIPKLKEFSGASWLEEAGMKLHISPQILLSLFNEFCDIQELGNYSNTVNDFRKHFVNWLNVKKEKGFAKKESSGGGGQKASKFEHNAVVLNEVLNDIKDGKV
ncbi:MAG: DUF4373 domain-containing protein [Prevotellaceae bacterium]|jgi:hypothetical protein|nr:DUF4373 domain-containing protein [Prevotellaceae bacterium]